MEMTAASMAASNFSFPAPVRECVPYGSGHINDTYRILADRYYILQRMNRNVFRRPEQVMENVEHVTRFLRKKIEAEGGDPLRETLNLVPAGDGKPYYKDSGGEFWRVFLMIENAVTYDQVPDERTFYESAVAFGHFQRMLADYPAGTLWETIPDFHNTVKRYADFVQAVRANASGRLEAAREETEFLVSHRDLSGILQEKLKSGSLPLRVTHNDTKLNNIMIDRDTGRAICVIDLDTVMPGLAVTDFGDSIRFGASTAAEDEKDLSKVDFDIHLYEIYAKGFIEGTDGALTDEEYRMLPYGALVITYEQALRFLGDYIAGDPYYKTDYPEHNLVRARTQIQLVKKMLVRMDEMKEIVERIR